MAITKTDLEISNISYTNKDFEAIYTELMDLAVKINNKMNPAESNEGDPFVVILKLLAFVSDKINYNIDKNILERFLTSATQEKSVRDLTSMLGYNMKYYQASTTSVICKYNFSGTEEYDETQQMSSRLNGIYIPQYTKFTDSTGSVMFVSTVGKYINPNSKSSEEIPVIQGELKNFTVLDSSTITLENLDEENRLFFPEPMVAENGVFISGGSSNDDSGDTEWKIASNLNSVEYGSYRYEFGYDSKRKLPYIKFPEWINEIIGSGLTVDYIVTNGLDGNVSSKSITSITLSDDYLPHYQNADIKVTAENIGVLNTRPADNGQNPETINEAYTGFKKTIGTYDTLVTCRDYANAIYNALDEYSNNYVSNIQVADRRTDINYGCSVSTFSSTGVQTESIISKDSSWTPVISAYDLCLYPLTASNDFEKSVDSSLYEGYNKTFTSVYDTSKIEEELLDGGLKCISHDYKRYKTGDIYAIKNYCNLEAVVSTVYKVNEVEQYDIILNIKNALAKNFNAREVDFGYDISTEKIREVMQNADGRIKNVDLYEPDMESVGYVINGVSDSRYYTMKEEPLKASDGSDSHWFKTIVAKNILAGRVELFNYDEAFNYGFGETSGSVTDDIESFTSRTRIGSVGTSGYELKSNEVIELISPSYITDGNTYPYGINYYLKLNGDKSQDVNVTDVSFSDSTITVTYDIKKSETEYESDTFTGTSLKIDNVELTASSAPSVKDSFLSKINLRANKRFILVNGDENTIVMFPDNFTNSKISKNDVYELKSGDELIMQWTNSSDKTEAKVFQVGDLIKTNFDMYTTKYRISKGKTPLQKRLPNGNTQYFFTLGTGEEVEKVKVNSQLITSKHYVYWSVKNSTNTIPWIENEYILEDDEYFFVTDMNFSELYTFGPGTLIKKTGLSMEWTAPVISNISELLDGDLDTFRTLFKVVECNSSTDTSAKNLEFAMQDIITLSSGDWIKASSQLTIPDNTFGSNIPNTTIISYKLGEDEWVQVESKPTPWRIRAILDINSGPDTPQTLVGNQLINFYVSGETEPVATVTSGKTFKLNVLKQEVGGILKPLTYIDLSLTKKNVSLYNYTLEQTEGLSLGSSFGDKYYGVVINDEYESKPSEIVLPKITGRNVYMMFNVTLSTSSDNVKLSTETGDVTGISCYNNLIAPTVSTNEFVINKSGTYIFRFSNITSSKITLKFSSKNIVCIVSRPRLVNSTKEINELLGLSTSTDIVGFISSNYSEQWKRFNAVNFIEPTKHIELSSSYKLSHPTSFYDYNNIANKWTIPVINLDESVIRIARSSRKA